MAERAKRVEGTIARELVSIAGSLLVTSIVDSIVLRCFLLLQKFLQVGTGGRWQKGMISEDDVPVQPSACN